MIPTICSQKNWYRETQNAPDLHLKSFHLTRKHGKRWRSANGYEWWVLLGVARFGRPSQKTSLDYPLVNKHSNGIFPFLIGKPSSIRVHFPAGYVRSPECNMIICTSSSKANALWHSPTWRPFLCQLPGMCLVYEFITCGQCHLIWSNKMQQVLQNKQHTTFFTGNQFIHFRFNYFINLDGYPLQAKKPVSAKENAKLLVGSGICRFLWPFALPILPPLDVAGSNSFRRLSKTSSLKYNSPKSQAQIKPWANGVPGKLAILLDCYCYIESVQELNRTWKMKLVCHHWQTILGIISTHIFPSPKWVWHFQRTS